MGEALDGHLQVPALGKTLDDSSIVGSETEQGAVSSAGELLRAQVHKECCDVTGINWNSGAILTPYVIYDQDIRSITAEEDGASTDGDMPTDQAKNVRSFSVGEVRTFPTYWQLHQTGSTSALLARDLVSLGLCLHGGPEVASESMVQGSVQLISQETLF